MISRQKIKIFPIFQNDEKKSKFSKLFLKMHNIHMKALSSFFHKDSDQVVKKHLNFHVIDVNSNSTGISKTLCAHFHARCARFYPQHTKINFKKSGRTLGGGAVSARRVCARL